MVSIAQVLVRDPQILLMDEPTNNLDLHHQLEMFDLIREISLERGNFYFCVTVFVNIIYFLHKTLTEGSGTDDYCPVEVL